MLIDDHRVTPPAGSSVLEGARRASIAIPTLCHVLVCLAVWLTYSARSTADRILVVVPPISAFVAAGFEHSMANMYVMPVGLLVATLDPAFVAANGLEAQAPALSWGRFLTGNLLPVTVGNVMGGAVLVGRFVYAAVRLPSVPSVTTTRPADPRSRVMARHGDGRGRGRVAIAALSS